MSGHVLVGVDGSPAAMAAVRWAAADAALRDVALRVIHACEPWAVDLPRPMPEGFENAVEEYCHGVARTAGIVATQCVPGLEVTTQVVPGPAAEALRKAALEADEVVVGSRGLGGFAGLVLGSVSLGLAGHVPRPVVVVPDAAPTFYGEIVVGFDGSARSEIALKYAFEQAARRKARLTVVHAWHMPALAPYAAAYGALIDDVFEAQSKAITEALKPWRDEHPDVDVREQAVCGHPVPAIRDAAATADLVVVGSRGLGLLGSAVLGSVSHGVLRQTRCPVAVVRCAS